MTLLMHIGQARFACSVYQKTKTVYAVRNRHVVGRTIGFRLGRQVHHLSRDLPTPRDSYSGLNAKYSLLETPRFLADPLSLIQTRLVQAAHISHNLRAPLAPHGSVRHHSPCSCLSSLRVNTRGPETYPALHYL